MAERVFYESEAIVDSLTTAMTSLNAGESASGLLSRLSVNVADDLNDALVSLLDDEQLRSDVTAIDGATPPRPTEGFGWRLRNVERDGQPAKMKFFRVRESWVSLSLSLAGLSLALLTMSYGIPLAAIGLLRTVWQHLITLEEKGDRLALEAYRALLRAELLLSSKGDGQPVWPTLSEIHAASGGREIKDTIAGLTLLCEKRLVEVKEWAGQKGDYSEPANRWFQVF